MVKYFISIYSFCRFIFNAHSIRRSGRLHNQIDCLVVHLHHHHRTMIRIQAVSRFQVNETHAFHRTNHQRIKKTSTEQHVDGGNRKVFINQLVFRQHKSIFRTQIFKLRVIFCFLMRTVAEKANACNILRFFL